MEDKESITTADETPIKRLADLREELAMARSKLIRFEYRLPVLIARAEQDAIAEVTTVKTMDGEPAGVNKDAYGKNKEDRDRFLLLALAEDTEVSECQIDISNARREIIRLEAQIETWKDYRRQRELDQRERELDRQVPLEPVETFTGMLTTGSVDDGAYTETTTYTYSETGKVETMVKTRRPDHLPVIESVPGTGYLETMPDDGKPLPF